MTTGDDGDGTEARDGRRRRAVARHAARVVRDRDPRRRGRRSGRRRGPAPPRRPARAPRRRHARSRRARRRRSTALGAALDVGVSRDAVDAVGPRAVAPPRRGRSISRADILAEPRFDDDEHARLLRETPQVLDEIRDDDSALATRWFDWLCSPGPSVRPHVARHRGLARARSQRATRAIALWRREVVADNLVIGARRRRRRGDRRAASSQRLAERLPRGARAARRTASPRPRAAAAAALILVDKPDRTQAQLRIGHLAARYGDPDTAGARDRRGGVRRHVQLAPDAGDPRQARLELRRRLRAAPVAAAALVRDLDGGRRSTSPARRSRSRSSCYADYAANGPTDDEVDFARSYLVGAMPFHVATARQRMQLAVRDAVFDLPAGYTAQLPEALAAARRDRRPRRVRAPLPSRRTP